MTASKELNQKTGGKTFLELSQKLQDAMWAINSVQELCFLKKIWENIGNINMIGDFKDLQEVLNL